MTDLLREGRKIDVNAKEKTVIAIDGISDSQWLIMYDVVQRQRQ